MAATPRISNLASSVMLNALGQMANNGLLRIYSGAPPADVELHSTEKLLAELSFSDQAFEQSDGLGMLARKIKDEPAARNDGEAKWFCVVTQDGVPIIDGDVGTNNAALILNSTRIAKGQRVSVDRFVVILKQK